jgi:mono/diheme cytochrome c family protein
VKPPSSFPFVLSARSLLAGLCLLGAGTRGAAAPAIDFNRDIRPILSDHCYACHGPDDNHRKAGLRLDQHESALSELKSGDHAIVPGRPDASSLVTRILTTDPDDLMPPPKDGKPLSREQIDLLVRWVKEGAAWQNHWSFIPPGKASPPKVEHKEWPANDLDRFILERIERAGLEPAPAADKPTLLRRVTFDLTGLPPTPEEVDAFVADASADAYEKVVERLLTSPHYGERMTLNWLDLARYADTSGYHFDGVRFMWLWRDWVIRAFNENKPYDVFTVEQLAGDLLPNATRDQRIATGFVRNNMTNDEGGADPDEYLNKYVADRVNTLGNVWLGMTVACAECHDHKFDPLKMTEYYQLYAFFHNVPEKGLDRIRTDNPPPRLPVPTIEQAMQFVEADFTLRDAEKTLQDRINELGETQEKWERETLDAPPASPDDAGLFARLPLDDSFAVLSDRSDLATKATTTAEAAAPAATHSQARFIRDDQPEFADGRLGKGLRFDGKMHLDLGPLVPFDSTNAFSYGAWVRVQGGGAILSKMEAGPGFRGFDLHVSDNRFEVHLAHRFPDDAIKVKTKDKFEGGGWRHVLVTYDGSTKASGVKVYVDGKARAVDAEKDGLKGSIANAEPVRLGSRRGEGHFKGQLDDVRFYERALTVDDARRLAFEGMLTILNKSRGNRSDEERADLQRFYKENYAVDFLRAEAALAKARKEKNDLIAAIPTSMIMEEMNPPRETYRLVRGDFRSKGERVYPGTPEYLPPMRKAKVSNENGRLKIGFSKEVPGAGWQPNRLDLAAWLVSPEHPLTARVTVNRYWAMFFGAGLVNTINDFGNQGEWPSHPELLDWLAARFRDGDPDAVAPVKPWDVKALVRMIVTSRTYRQSSIASPEKRERDPYNRLLARSPRLQLDAEFVRDNALAVSGLLNAKIGGGSVKPYQPPGLWDGTDSVFVQDHGEDLYRRGMYVFWRRSAHYPAFATFDAPNREVCTFVRQRTQTPLQSLVLMNDPAFVECARGLAQRVMYEEPDDLDRRLQRAFRLTLGRVPGVDEVATLKRTYEQQLEGFQSDPKAADELLKVGESKVPESLDQVKLAAMTAVANLLLNLNETITK